MLKFANKLSDDYEYAIVWWGQSNARPQGDRAEALAEDPLLGLPTAGQQITITAVSTADGVGTISVAETLVANAWVGAKVRFVTTYPGTSVAIARVGYGTVTANTAPVVSPATPSQLTVTWDATGASPNETHLKGSDASPEVTFSAATDEVHLSGHRVQTGDQIRFEAGGGLPTGLSAGTTYFAIRVDNDHFKVAASLADAIAGTAIDLQTDGTPTNEVTLYRMVGYVYFDDSYRQYSNIRVLQPYIPESAGAYPTGVPSVPGYTFPDSIDTYEHAALFLPYALDEGVEGYTYSSTATATSTSSLTDSAAEWQNDVFEGAYVLAGSSYGVVSSNSGTVLTLTSDGWTGGTPSSTATYKIIIPHYLDNPRRHLPGFRYPSGDSQPGGDGTTGSIYCRPNSVYTPSHNELASYTWTYLCGAMLPFAWRLANKLGKRINIIPLGINSSVLTQSSGTLAQGYQGTIGWYNQKKNDWTPSKTGSLAERLEDLVTVMAPAALTAEGNTKPLRILGIVGIQGESDCISETGRTLYSETLRAFYSWLRGKIVDAGLSPYASSVEIPVVHPRLPTDRWENEDYDTIIQLLYGASYGIDTEGVVNAAIDEFAAKDGFAATIDTDDSPSNDSPDIVHFNGEGEERNGRLAAVEMAELINSALGQGNDTGAVAICNLALSNIGESAKITSIDPPDGSAQATHCARFYPIARDSLLEMKQWSFANRRVALVSVDHDLEEWDYAYALPSDVLSVTSVQGLENADDYAYRYGTPLDTYPGAVVGKYTPQPYAIEQDADGNRVLYTDVENAVIRYTAKITDTAHFPSLFKMALSWHLAGMLAGPIIKGDQGAAEAKRCQMMMAQFLGRAETSDANQRKINPEHYVSWIQNR